MYLLQWLKQHKPEFEFSVLSLKSGKLDEQFVKLCVHFYNYETLTSPDEYSYFQRFLIKLGVKKINNKATLLFQRLSTSGFEVVYSNTVKSIPFGAKIKRLSPNIKHIVHLHELNVIIKQLLPDFKDYLKDLDHIIVPSVLVKDRLIKDWDVTENVISQVYECTEIITENSQPDIKFNDEVFHVGASGTVHWRKGYDIFIQVARYFKTHYPDIKIQFTWVGKLYELERLIIEEDLRKLELSDMVNFVGEVDNTASIFSSFDVFLMTSREDPFPLVCIEIGMLGKPIVSFEQATGTNEILAKGGGFVVPYLDIDAMAEKVMYYIDFPEKLKEHGHVNTVEFSKFMAESICPQLVSIVEKQIHR